jgi:hypothetical protein
MGCRQRRKYGRLTEYAARSPLPSWKGTTLRDVKASTHRRSDSELLFAESLASLRRNTAPIEETQDI